MVGTTLLHGEAGSRGLVRRALGQFATGVTVVTASTDDGVPVGTTASAVSSLSLEPPLLLVCLERSSLTLASIRDRQGFAVNVLAETQAWLSANFAKRGDAASWEGVCHRLGEIGNPYLEGALAVLDCSLEQCLDGGDHEIVVGRLVAIEHGEEDLEPLLHYRGSYASLRAARA